ncbi:MAG: hypothetical protein GF365_04015 [Candidatus Buchananbacteria bacterium]|nr:hypothetical protein [Candidatus Buchananbacteria bacterium]
MGIKVEFNPDLALRNIEEFNKGNRRIEECIPPNIEVGKIYNFLKKDQRNYWLFGEIPLIETKGNEILSRPRAGIIILEATHFIENNEIFTKGRYKIIKILQDKEIYFEGFDKIGTRDY